MKKIGLLLWALTMTCASATAENVLTVNNATIPQGGEGTVSVELTNDTEFAGFQFSLNLPEGIQLVSRETGSRFAEDHSVGYTTHDGVSVFTCFSASNAAISGNDGVLLTLKLKADASLAVGTVLSGTVDDIYFGTKAEQEYQLPAVSFTITVGEPLDPHIILDENSTQMPTAATGADVRVLRTITAGQWETIVLPFDMSAAQVAKAFGAGVKLAAFTSWESQENESGETGHIKMCFETAPAIAANTPCLINTPADIAVFEVDGVDMAPEEEAVVQVGKKKAERGYMTGTYVAGTAVPEENLYLDNNAFHYSDGSVETKGFRAYFELADVLENAADAPNQVELVVDNVTVGIMPVSLHRAEGTSFDLQGRSVLKMNKKGLFIRDGKKVVVK